MRLIDSASPSSPQKSTSKLNDGGLRWLHDQATRCFWRYRDVYIIGSSKFSAQTSHNPISHKMNEATAPYNRSNTEKWTRTHRDTGYPLREIHAKRSANLAPNRTDFKASTEGQRLVAKFGNSRVNHNWTTKLQRYNDFLTDGRGDFTTEQLEIAGIITPEGNEDRIAGLDLDAGSDSEEWDFVEEQEPEEAVQLGRRSNIRPPRPPVRPAAAPAQQQLVPAKKSSMTYRCGMIPVPAVEHNGSTKVCFAMYLFLPAGVNDCSVRLSPDLKSAWFEWDNIPLGYHDELFREVANALSMPQLIACARNHFQHEVAHAPDVQRIGDVIRGSCEVVFPEPSEDQMYHPLLGPGHGADPLFIDTLPGGINVAMCCVFQRRNEPSLPSLREGPAISLEQQAEQAARAYPALRSMLLRTTHFASGGRIGSQLNGPPPPPEQIHRQQLSFPMPPRRRQSRPQLPPPPEVEDEADIEAEHQMRINAALAEQMRTLEQQISGGVAMLWNVVQQMSPQQIQATSIMSSNNSCRRLFNMREE